MSTRRRVGARVQHLRRSRARDRERVRQGGHYRPDLFGDVHREAGRDSESAHRRRHRRCGPCSRERSLRASRSRRLASSPERPTSEGSFAFVVKAQNGNASDDEGVHADRAAAPEREVSFRSGAAAEQRGRDSPREDLHRNGWKRHLHLGAPVGRTARGCRAQHGHRSTISGTPQAAGVFAFGVTATDSEGRVTTSAAALTVAPRLTIRTLRLKPAKVASTYQMKLATVRGVQPVKWSLVSGSFRLASSCRSRQARSQGLRVRADASV